MNASFRSIVALAVSAGACLLVGVSGALVTAPAVREWYPLIEKPPWTPPPVVFGPVWTTLYLLMGLAAWLIWRGPRGSERTRALWAFAVQLALNAVWSPLFFGLQRPGWAALEILLLWGAIVATMALFARIQRLAAGLLVPYLLWVSFAVALNVAIWNLNR